MYVSAKVKEPLGWQATTLRAEATFSQYEMACEKYFSLATSYRENVTSARRVAG